MFLLAFYALVVGNILNAYVPLPSKLKEIPFADQSGIVTKVTRVTLPGIPHHYNSSLTLDPEGDFFLFYRHDLPYGKDPYKFNSYIGVSKLDSAFSCTTSPISTSLIPSEYSEDPRALLWGGGIYLSYNDEIPHIMGGRSIHITKLSHSLTPSDNRYNLDLCLKPVEKNWAPFLHNDEVYFEYSINPHKIIKWNQESNIIEHQLSHERGIRRSIEWERKWGILRGGTPAQLVGNEYLSFFHSSFRELGVNWYVMGAYTFEAEPPFRITKISKAPIIFKGIYDTPPSHTAPKNLRSLFPAGFVIDGDEIHVSCGENDCATKIISFNKEKLLESLSPALNSYYVFNGEMSVLDHFIYSIKEDHGFQECTKGLGAINFEIVKVPGLGKIITDNPKDWVKNFLRRGINPDEHIGNLIHKYTLPGSVALDVGAHIGMQTLSMSKAVGSSGLVYAIEPQWKMASENIWNCLLNNCKENVIHLKFALSDRFKDTCLDPTCLSDEGATMIGSGGDETWTTSLDSLEISNISLIKISVQNDIEKVINGGIDTISRELPVLILRVGGCDPNITERSFKKLKKLGYRFELIKNDDYLAVPSFAEEIVCRK